MTMQPRLIECSIESDSHSGPLRRVDGKWVCQEHWAAEQGIEVKKAKGRDVTCPKCGQVLMTKFRGGRISITSMTMKGKTAILTCDCGYEKVIRNPFGGRPQSRDEMAFARLKEESKKREEAKNGSP